ncbi:hypothetical protein Ahy_B08g094177 [Arachis hypogaea]|uniref:UDP-glucuronate decarboxylase n=2 Tax=Arachis TaxID=3817 RepID=A0A444Y881_ARAHY|nr:hypothetical protein Ahy_B08g094177 [Arachis hypogaea]
MARFQFPALWQACLASAFRTALACTIVGSVTLLGPPSIQTLITFPAFSYVSLVLIIINDATFGDTFRACWLALYATIQAIGPAMLTLWAVHPARLSNATTAVAVAVAAFVVVLPSDRSTHLLAKRISLGQIVLVYVTGYANGVHTDPLMHPLRLAASTALGVIASLLALLLPYPRLATSEVKRNYKVLRKSMLKRMQVLIKVICEDDINSASSHALVTHANSFVTTQTKLFQAIVGRQDSIRWETPLLKVFRLHCWVPMKRLQQIDTNLRGMELALKSTNSFPVNIVILNEDLKHGLSTLEEHVTLTTKHGASLTVPESSTKATTNFLQSFHTMPTTHQDLPTYFFLFCAKLLHNTSFTTTSCVVHKDKAQISPNSKGNCSNYWAIIMGNTNLVPAIKFSISLGLAVFMGLTYSKENGFWAGLPVAVSYVSGREPTFRAANVKAQGTVLGTVYGVLGCFVFEKFLPIRFVSLLPWFVFASILQRSRMYGPAGGISAVIGAVLILGRKNFGPPSEFAIARIIETFIGLLCSIFVDLIFMPKRASTLAKVGLSQSLVTIGESIGSLGLIGVAGKTDLEDNIRKFRMQVNELRKFVVEAEIEPNFWFLKFHKECYNKLLGSLSNLVDLLHFGDHALKFIQQEFHMEDEIYDEKEDVNMLQDELGHIKELICSSIQHLEEISRMKSLKILEEEIERKRISSDLEHGKSTKCDAWMLSILGKEGIENKIDSFLQRSTSVVESLYDGENEKELKSQIVLSLSALGFCLKTIMQEVMQIEECMKELVQWNNPNSEINLSLTMANNSSNGDHQTSTKQPPLPSPLRFSKFFQSNMRILVTGGAGFIGSHLVDRLMENEKNEVIVADNYFTGSKDNLKKWIGHPRFELIRHDVTEPLLIEVDQIYHLACPASPIFYKYNPVKTIKTNVIGTLNMLGLAKRVGARILLTSTSEVYGDPLVHPQPESYWGNVNPIGVRSCYDEGKRVAETLMFDYHRQHGLEIRIARIFNTYGPRMNIDDGRVVSNFIAQALRGEPLTVQSPGTQTRSFCYVSDMVDGLIRLMEGPNTGPINLGNPGEFTMVELAETVKELINPKVEIKMVENTPDDPRQRKPDITQAKELLGWEPKIKLRDGLPRMEEDFRLRLGVDKSN